MEKKDESKIKRTFHSSEGNQLTSRIENAESKTSRQIEQLFRRLLGPFQNGQNLLDCLGPHPLKRKKVQDWSEVILKVAQSFPKRSHSNVSFTEEK